MDAETEELLRNAPKAGEVFAGKYRIDRVLGVGGMGYVLAATHMHLHERVAIKMLLPELAKHAETVERFLREGRAAIKIRSEHCVRVQDVGELPDRTPYMVMEYLDGADLADIIKTRGRVPVAVAVDYVLQACEAIAEAHAMSIVHRDLKPANLFLQRFPNGAESVKVLDFGISKIGGQGEGQMSMTRTSAMMGSPLYMSPEQLVSSKNVDARADQWALGVILFELIAGKPPFMAETLPELGALVLSGDAPWLATVAPDAPSDLCSIVATCLKKKPAERFTNLADFTDSIAPFGSQKSRLSTERVVQTLGMPAVRAQRVSRVPQTNVPTSALAGTMVAGASSSPGISGQWAATPAPSSSWNGPAAPANGWAGTNPDSRAGAADPSRTASRSGGNALKWILPIAAGLALVLGGTGFAYKKGLFHVGRVGASPAASDAPPVLATIDPSSSTSSVAVAPSGAASLMPSASVAAVGPVSSSAPAASTPSAVTSQHTTQRGSHQNPKPVASQGTATPPPVTPSPPPSAAPKPPTNPGYAVDPKG